MEFAASKTTNRQAAARLRRAGCAGGVGNDGSGVSGFIAARRQPQAFEFRPHERRSFVLAFLAAAVTTPLGTLASHPFISRIDAPLPGLLLALSAGALIHVGATRSLPRAEREPRRYSLVALAAGIRVALVIVFSKGHDRRRVPAMALPV